MNWIKDNWFKLSLMILGVIIAWSFYYNLVLLPETKEFNRKIEAEVEHNTRLLTEEFRKQARENCIITAEKEFASDFELNSTPVAGQDGVREWKSNLLRDNIEANLKSEKEFCIKLHPVE